MATQGCGPWRVTFSEGMWHRVVFFKLNSCHEFGSVKADVPRGR